ncbi:MAG TPA: hypothetical protein VHQ21_03925 [Rhodanobacteraceae bacterium]|nr:hypothetical protein [Rhodanobacteraceae bacterium]
MTNSPRGSRPTPARAKPSGERESWIAGFLFSAINVALVVSCGFLPSSDPDSRDRLALAFAMIDPIVQFGVLYLMLAVVRDRAMVGPSAIAALMLTSVLLWGWYHIVPADHVGEALVIVAWVALGRAWAFFTKLRRLAESSLTRALLPPAVTAIVSIAVAVAVGMAAAIHATGHRPSAVNPILLVAIVYYALHAFVSLPAMQRRLRAYAERID